MRARAAWWLAGSVVVAGACFTRPGRPPATDAPAAGEPLAAALAATDPDEAARRFADVARRYPPLLDYALYFGARAAARAGRIDEARAGAARVVTEHPDSVWRGRAALLAGELARDVGDRDAARTWLAAARDSFGKGDRWTRATIALAELDDETGDAAGALDLARAVRRAAPRSLAARRARRLMDRLRAARPDLFPEPDASADEAEFRLAEGDLAGARASAAGALEAGATGETASRALWAGARADHGLGRAEDAERACLALADRGDEKLGPRALLTAGRWRWNADDDRGAVALFRDVERRFPSSGDAAEALYAIGRIEQEASRWDAAARAYADVAARHPRSTLAAESQWRAAWVRYLADDPAGAAEAFERVARRTGHATRIAAEYWRARALARAGRADEARDAFAHVADRHRMSYYAPLAEAALGVEPAPAPPAVAPPRPAFPAGLPGAHGERAALLARLAHPRFVRLELQALQAGGGVDRRDLLDAYAAIDAPGPALRLAVDAGARSTGGFRRALYPLGFWDTVARAAAERGLDPFLVLALIRQESLFDPDAVSAADAHGLMQLLPRTARELAAADSRPAPDRARLHDVDTNVTLGTALLRRLLDRYDGSRVKALAAYNAGEDAVAKWERRYAGRPEDEFTELISFRETRDYVKAVLRNYRAYQRIYAPSASATSAGSPPNAPFDMIAITSPGRADSTR